MKASLGGRQPPSAAPAIPVGYFALSAVSEHWRVAELIAADGPLMVTEPVMLEVLSGARDDVRENDLRRLLLRAGLLRFDATTDFEAATRIYQRCRRSGMTPHGMIGCMIAAFAWAEAPPFSAATRIST